MAAASYAKRRVWIVPRNAHPPRAADRSDTVIDLFEDALGILDASAMAHSRAGQGLAPIS
jgi:hypothetical protein